MKYFLLATLIVCLPALAISCDRPNAAGRATVEPRAGAHRVVVTTAMIADIVRNVGGSHVAVQSLMGAGVDPHLYRPTRSDIQAMLDADIVFYNGLNLEGKMSDTFVRVARSGKPVYAVTEMIDESYLLSPKEFAGHFDPHVWMDPEGWQKAAEVVIDAMSTFDAPRAEEYKRSGAAYIEQLRALDEYAQTSIDSIPQQRRVLVTAHDAFNYFARAYSIEVRGIQGISTESEAGLRQIEELVNTLVQRDISAVFTETSVSDQYVRALIEGAKAQGRTVTIGGQLFSDAMGDEGSYEGTYVGMIDHNVTLITRALGGQAPQRGMHGKLASSTP